MVDPLGAVGGEVGEIRPVCCNVGLEMAVLNPNVGPCAILLGRLRVADAAAAIMEPMCSIGLPPLMGVVVELEGFTMTGRAAEL